LSDTNGPAPTTTPPIVVDATGGRPDTVTGIDLKIGDKDAYGSIVELVFHNSPGRYTIYQVAPLEVRVAGDTSALHGQIKINQLITKIGEYRQIERIRQLYNSGYAYAVRLALDGDVAQAEAALQQLLDSVQAYLMRSSRLSYLLGAIYLLGITLAVFGVLALFNLIGDLGVHIFSAMTFAAMGGVMSVAIGIKKIDLDHQEKKIVNCFYGSIRTLIAMIAGVVVFFMIESGFALSFLKISPNTPYAYLIAAFLSGFSEMLVPNLMAKMDGQAGAAGTSPTGTPPAEGQVDPKDNHPDTPKK